MKAQRGKGTHPGSHSKKGELLFECNQFNPSATPFKDYATLTENVMSENLPYQQDLRLNPNSGTDQEFGLKPIV